MHNKKVIIISSIVLCLVVLGIATSYALYTFNVTGDTIFRIGVGNLELSISDNETDDVFVMENVYPIKDEVGLNQDGYTFTVTNTGSLNGDYSVYLDDVVLVDETHEILNRNLVKFNLVNNETGASKTDFLTSFSDNVIDSGTLEPNESVTYTLKMWVDYNAGNEAQNKYFAARVRIDGTQHAVISDTPVAPTKLYTIVNDANGNGEADIGDEIALGDEHFYVISNDGTNINALSKYNLNVGDYALESTIGIQNASAIGYPTQANATVQFSSSSQRGTNYSDYQGSIVEGYVNNYVTYLNTNNSGLNATGRLISLEELETLGCSSSDYSCTNAPSWVYSTSYWSGSAFNTYYVWHVSSDGYFIYNYYYTDNNFGVRPVITIGA